MPVGIGKCNSTMAMLNLKHQPIFKNHLFDKYGICFKWPKNSQKKIREVIYVIPNVFCRITYAHHWGCTMKTIYVYDSV
jgi:hypothetical protein